MGFALHNRMHLCNENAKPKVSEKKEKKVSLAWWSYLEQFGTALFIQPTFHLAKNGYGWHSMLSVRLSYTLNFAQRE